MNTRIFKVAPDYTIAHHYTGSDCICLDEWIGRTVEEFAAAMGRQCDQIEETTICGRKIVEYVWTR